MFVILGGVVAELVGHAARVSVFAFSHASRVTHSQSIVIATVILEF